MFTYEKFKKLDFNDKQLLAEINSPLLSALAVLQIANDRFDIEYMTAEGISECLENASIAVKPIAITRALSRADNKVLRKKYADGINYKIMLHGSKEVKHIFGSNFLNIINISSGT